MQEKSKKQKSDYELRVEAEYAGMFRVRGLTAEEKQELEKFNDNPEGRIARIIRSNQIDWQRYEEAKISNPQMKDHMTRMQASSQNFIAAIVKIYEEDHDITEDSLEVVGGEPEPQPSIAIEGQFVSQPA